jgi:hypothetical protein
MGKWARAWMPGIVVATLCTGHVAAENKTNLFASHGVAPAVTLPDYANPATGLVGKLDARALEAATIDIPLPDGRIITVVQQHVSRDERQQRLTWTGRIAGSPGGHVLLTRRNATIAGFLAHGQQRYELQPGMAGRHVIFEVSEQLVTPADAVCVPAAAIAAGQPQPGDSGPAGGLHRSVGDAARPGAPREHDHLRRRVRQRVLSRE